MELMVAMTMLAIVTLAVSVTIGQIYLNQKKIVLRQSFHDEARLLMERIVQLVRNNTVDYDRYFIEYGPDIIGDPGFGVCPEFSDKQVPVGTTSAQRKNNPSQDLPGYEIGKQNRAALGYESIFYWDTTGDGEQDRNLGGTLLDGTDDPCVAAFQYNELNLLGRKGVLFLINAERTIRTSVILDDNGTSTPPPLPPTSDDRVLIERQYGIDTDGDKKIDHWSAVTQWDDLEPAGNKCEIEDPNTPLSYLPVLGQPTDDIEGQKFCLNAYENINILPDKVEVKGISFIPSPNKDPFLAFRVDDAQIHPHVYIDFQLEMTDPEKFGFNVDSPPNTRLRTSASSRVFGDNRK